MKVNALDWFTNLIEENRNLTSLGFGKRVKKKFDKVDAVDNISQIQFEDPDVERICHEHGVYTAGDADKVTSIKGWFTLNGKITKFNELKYFTGLKTIEDQAFSYCISLQSVIIPSSVTSIRDRAFMYCDSLQSINIPSSVTSIGERAFGKCESLQTVVIPDSITSIRDSVFWFCSSLQSFYISKNCPVYNQIRQVYPDIQLIEPKVNEASNLGLASKVKKNFEEKTEEDKVKNISHITKETLVDLYDSWGHVSTNYQSLKFPTLRTYRDFRLCSGKIGKSYSKFIDDMTDGEVVCRFSAACWGEEDLDAIEFWREGDRKVLKYQLYGEVKYDTEYINFYKNRKNYILDWFIPATLKFLEKYPEYIGRFYAKLIK